MIIENNIRERKIQGERDGLLCLIFALVHLSFLSIALSITLSVPLSANDHSKEGKEEVSQWRTVIKPCIIQE